jgi:hypothetical protein
VGTVFHVCSIFLIIRLRLAIRILLYLDQHVGPLVQGVTLSLVHSKL